ncbi:uncharacterized protein DEA37_0012770, partial [Paragonimus westermani]
SDTPNYGTGGVTPHRFPEGSKKAAAHVFKTLTGVKRNYSHTEKEALAVIFSVRQFQIMLCGPHFILLTSSLTATRSTKVRERLSSKRSKSPLVLVICAV